MDKKRLMEMLKNMAGNMTEEEIREVIERLEGRRSAISYRLNHEKSDWLRLLGTTDRLDAKLAYHGPGEKSGILDVAGPSLLTVRDYLEYRHTYVTPIKQPWWLFDGLYVPTTGTGVPMIGPSGWALRIRPVLIIERISGDLVPGEVFSIRGNGEQFRLLNQNLAIRTAPKEGRFSFDYSWTSKDYWDSDARDVVNDWYKDLIRSSKKK